MAGIAAQVMAWQRRMSGSAGPLGASGEASNGNPVTVELYLNGAWIDITSYVMTRDGGENIAVTRGRPSEGQGADPATCTFQLNNRDGRFSPRNPTGIYYGSIGRNTPLRVSVPDGLGGKNYRFWGEVSSWPQRWDTTGTDIWVDIEAAGILRRLSQGAIPANSVVYNGILDPQIDSLLAYWPCEDPEGATSVDSPLVTCPDMYFSGSPVPAAYSGFGSSDPVITLSGASISGYVPKYNDGTTTQLQVRFLLYVPADGLPDLQHVMRLTMDDTNTVVYWDVFYNSPTDAPVYGRNGTLSLAARDGDQALLGGTADSTLDIRGKIVRVSMELANNGTATSFSINILDIVADVSHRTSGSQASAQLTRLLKVSMAPATLYSSKGMDGSAVGHITAQNTITDITDLGEHLDPIGESAGRRFQRICAEEGIAFSGIGDLDNTVTMGSQPRVKPLDILLECEEADNGILFENLSVFGLGYRTRADLYNQDAALSLSYVDNQLAEVPTPVDDDQLTKNSITATNSNTDISASASLLTGALSTVDPPAGVGVYGDSVSVNLSSDAYLADQANWRLHLGTVDESRYPQISVNLGHSQFTVNSALRMATINMRPGDRLVITNLPSWLPPDDISVIVLGISETIDHYQHQITFNCAPESPYRVATADDAVLRIDTDGSALYADAASGDTSVYVTPTTGNVWTTDTAETPWDIEVGGEVMTVTTCSSRASDSFTRTVSNSWGTATSGQVWTEVNGNASDRAVNGTQGSVTLAATATDVRFQLLVPTMTDTTVRCWMAVGQVSTGNHILPGIILRYQNTGSFYRVRLHFRTDSAVYLVVTNAATEIGAEVDTGLTYVANQGFWLTANITGNRIRARTWADGTLEPPSDVWHIDRTITSNIVSSGYVGVSASEFAGTTNVNPVLYFESFDILDPQTFTVTRSVNGVVKAHSLGDDVRLANPSIIAL